LIAGVKPIRLIAVSSDQTSHYSLTKAQENLLKADLIVPFKSGIAFEFFPKHFFFVLGNIFFLSN